MISILNKERIYFSRRHWVIHGRHKPDAIFLSVSDGNSHIAPWTITVGYESYNHYDGVIEVFKKNDFDYDEETNRYFKLWTIDCRHIEDGLALLDKVMDGLAAAQESSPFILYASPQQKGLADYYRFLNSSLPKVGYGEVMRALGYGEDSLVAACEEETDTEIEDYLIAPYKQGLWAAWASGDYIVPLFPSETEAVKFLRSRAACSMRDKITVRTIPVYKQRKISKLYVLVDQTKNVEEKIAWLQSEIARLQGQSKTAAYQG